MKNNYGFTLIELLAIVVILGVIIAVAAPNMTKQINKKEETDQTILDEKISNAAHMYIAKYYSDKVVDGTCNSSTCRFTLNDLEQDGLINLKGKNCTNVMAKDMFYLSSDNPNIKDSYNFKAIKPPNASDCASDKIGK
mgnify:FL=1